MKSKNLQTSSVRGGDRASFWSRATAVLAIVTLLTSSFAIVVSAQRSKGQPSAAKLTDEQQILHVLNRLGFGARPGDVERVKAIGIDKYIAQQLEPAKIDDEGVLVLAGTLKTEEMKVTYRLRFAMNAKVWKLLGMNVDTSTN